MKRPRTDPYYTDRELRAEVIRLAKRINPADPLRAFLINWEGSDLSCRNNLHDSDIEAAEAMLVDLGDAIYALNERSIQYAKEN